ncbi:fatty acid CoA ligase family protein [Streptomyces sp. NPDC002730]|uniref:fatty acid CoA ligase family protein n=1 Tax=Streptomyces sp. NPDC002730 TaxID=3364662 RepID=UPI00367393AA
MTFLTELGLDPRAGLADYLECNARALPGKIAIVYPDGREWDGSVRYGELSYGQLQSQVEQLGAGFARIGITKGMKTVLMMAPGPDLFAVVFALFRIGAVPVVVDPGMGVKRMLHCYRAVGAEAFIGPPVAHAVRMFSYRSFAGVRIHVTVGRRWFWGGEPLDRLRCGAVAGGSDLPGGDDLLMIGFTTGSTGPAKGVEYTHRMAAAMARQINAVHGRGPDEVSLVTMPLYGIFDLLFGSTLVLAPLAPAKVAGARPDLVAAALARFEVTSMAASPALLRVVGEYLARHATRLPALRCVVAGGAPVPPDVVAVLRAALDEHAEIHITYGASEVLPISSIEAGEVLGETAALSALGAGTCVGRPTVDAEVRIVRVTDEPLPLWDHGLAVAAGEVGEIAVAGPAVSPRYHAAPAADAQHKIREESEGGPPRLWHRTGDLGYLDHTGRLWFCGRRTQRVRTAEGELHTVRCEGVFHAHPLVRRTALVGVGAPGAQRPVVCVETEPGVSDEQWQDMLPELRQLAAGQRVSKGLTEFLRHPAFPVDVRHNAKIGREQLARWASRKLGAGAGRSRGQWALRAFPLAGWAYLLTGLVHPFDQPVLVAVWWINVLLSVLVHGAQIPWAMPRGRAAGYGAAATAGLTMLYGAAWWRLLPEAGTYAAPGRKATASASRR